VSPISREGEPATPSRPTEAARKRAAVETFARHEAALRRTARRYSLCGDDADDALQRGLEILLTKAPSDDPRELIRWTQTVVKHEALAVRRDRERILAGPAAAARDETAEDWVALIPSSADGPPERAERREAVARSREALQALKPQELRALTLLAEGYSYAEIGEITGYSQTKVNRCLAEGRERFRGLLARSEDGRRCAEMGPLLSAFCDGEATVAEAAALRQHLRACSSCRATLRTYRAAPKAALALAPALPVAETLLDRAHGALAGLAARVSGGGATDSTLASVASGGGTRGVGMAALAKVVAICVGTAGGAAACVATGVVPAPLGISPEQAKAPAIERRLDPTLEAEWSGDAGVDYESAPQPAPVAEEPAAGPIREEPKATPQPSPTVAPSASSGAVEYAPEPAPVAEPSSGGSAGSPSGSAAGEFGP
jgi:RNA polymerase sigma factor (sigma-70 family)